MIYLAALAAVIAVFIFYRKTQPPVNSRQRYVLILLRAIALIVLLLLLLNPIIYFLQYRSLKQKYLFLTDRSESMDLVLNGVEKADLISEFKLTLEGKIKSAGYDVIDLEFAAGLDGSRASTNLTRTLNEVSVTQDLEDVKGIYLLSDGWFKDEDLSFLDNYLIPIHVPLFGYQDPEQNLELLRIRYNKKAYTNELFPIIAEVNGNEYRGRADIKLTMRDHPEVTRELDFSVDRFQEILFEPELKDTGLIPFQIEVVSDSLLESDLTDNSYPGAVQVVKNRMKILMIADRMVWDLKFINDAISANPRWDSEFLLWDNSLKLAGRNTSLSEHLENSVVIILFNRGELRFANDENTLIRNFLKEGGGLILFGNTIADLSDLLSTETLRLKPDSDEILFFTEESRDFQIFNRIDSSAEENIPPLDYLYVNTDVEARVLARIGNDQQSPAIVYSEREQGRILHFCFFNLWKWQLWQADNSYNKFMTDLLMWMGQKNTDRFLAYTSRNLYFQGEEVRIILQVYDETLLPVKDINARFEIRTESGKLVREGYMNFGEDEYSAVLEELEAGRYDFRIINETTGQETEGEFLINSANNEARDRGFNEPLLKFIASRTDGTTIREDELENVEFPAAIGRNESIQVELPLYKKIYIILVFLISFCLELYLRKRWGLL